MTARPASETTAAGVDGDFGLTHSEAGTGAWAEAGRRARSPLDTLPVGVFAAQPRYLVPVGGMFIGNAMTAAAVALNRLGDDVRAEAPRIEAMLAFAARRPPPAGPPLRRRQAARRIHGGSPALRFATIAH